MKREIFFCCFQYKFAALIKTDKLDFFSSTNSTSVSPNFGGGKMGIIGSCTKQKESSSSNPHKSNTNFPKCGPEKPKKKKTNKSHEINTCVCFLHQVDPMRRWKRCQNFIFFVFLVQLGNFHQQVSRNHQMKTFFCFTEQNDKISVNLALRKTSSFHPHGMRKLKIVEFLSTVKKKRTTTENNHTLI